MVEGTNMSLEARSWFRPRIIESVPSTLLCLSSIVYMLNYSINMGHLMFLHLKCTNFTIGIVKHYNHSFLFHFYKV